MNLIFFIKSVSVYLENYTIKDIPGSSGRLDVISRCILASIYGNYKNFDKIEIWVFLDRYGSYIFSNDLLENTNFPKNEILLTDFLVNCIKEKEDQQIQINKTSLDIFTALEQFLDKKYEILILDETGEDFDNYISQISNNKNVLFIIGDQTGDFLNMKELLELKLPKVSLGKQPYLASSVIRLIKMKLDQRF